MAGEPLAEIREADAPPEVARIYAEIRLASGLPLVNLAWRLMAALPGVLPWAWGLVGPVYRSGEVAGASARLTQAASGLALEFLWRDDLVRAGLQDADRRRLADLLEVYNRGNAQNLIGWSALLRHLDGGDGPEVVAEAAGDDAVQTRPLPPPLPPLPPLPRRDDLEPASRALVEKLAGRHASFPAGQVPSLYLHLATWPGLLAPLDERLEKAMASGALARAASALSAIADAEAGRLAPLLRETVAPPAPAERERIVATLGTLTAGGIQEMIAVGVALARALG